MATWKLQNRRGVATLERLGELAGTGIVLAGSEQMPDGLSDAQRAIAVAETGEFCVTLALDTACEGKTKRVYRAMTPDSGAHAAVFLAHGIAATTARLASAPGHHLSSARQEEARALLREHLPWSDDDEREIELIAGDVNPTDLSGLDEARLATAYGAASRIVGDNAAQRLPGFAPWFGGDGIEMYAAARAWQICWNHMLTRFLEVTDPAGLQASG